MSYSRTDLGKVNRPSAYFDSMFKEKINYSKVKKNTEEICIGTQDDQCKANLHLDNAMKELAELEKSDMNATK